LDPSFSFRSLSFEVFNLSVCDFLTSKSFPLCSIDGGSLYLPDPIMFSFYELGFCEDFLPIPGASTPPLVATACVLERGPDLEPGF